MQLLTYARPTQTIYATFLQWFVPLGWGATRPSGPLAYAATTHTKAAGETPVESATALFTHN